MNGPPAQGRRKATEKVVQTIPVCGAIPFRCATTAAFQTYVLSSKPKRLVLAKTRILWSRQLRGSSGGWRSARIVLRARSRRLRTHPSQAFQGLLPADILGPPIRAMVVVAVQLDGQTAVVGPLDDKVDAIKAHRHLRPDPIAEVEQAAAEILLEVGIADFEDLTRADDLAFLQARHTAVGSIRAAVENEVQRLLPHGRANAETVAKVLALSARTLSRRLSAEGTTFEEVVDELRRSLALEYLKEAGFPLTQIAWLVGYESPTSFSHAFKRWTGRSPSAARREKRLPEPP